MGLVAAPRIELFTNVICHQINEEMLANHSPADDMPILLLDPAQCRHSIPVQRQLAELNLTISFVMGVLCVLTTPFWGALSDRIGRKTVLGLNQLSFVFGDLVLLAVLSNPGKDPYMWLLLYPAFEGLFGGMGKSHGYS